MPVKISAIEGNRQALDGGAMFGNAPKNLWQKWAPCDEQSRIELACRSLLIEQDGKVILCETGIGAYMEPKLADRYGVQNPGRSLLLEGLAELNIRPEDVDLIILSHLHFDHAGGLLPPYQASETNVNKGGLTLQFPRASYCVSRQAWERARHPHERDRASFIPGLCEALEQSGRLFILESLDQKPNVLPKNFDFFISQGHTPGQLHSIIRGDSKTIYFCGDLVPGTAWVHIPITMGYDRFAELVIDEKHQLYSKIEKDGGLMFFTHDARIALAGLQKNERGQYVAIEPVTKPIRMNL